MRVETPIHLAIAHEHVIFRKGVMHIISSFPESYDFIIEANDGRELIHKLETAKTLPDICILELHMPRLNGFETLREIKLRWPEIKVLILTMLDNEQTITKVFKDGADGYIAKESDPEELRRALKELFHNGLYYSVAISKYVHQLLHRNDLVPKISDRENSFLSLCGTELSYKEIAHRMGLSVRTVEGYRDDLFSKLELHSRVGLAMYGVNTGIIPFRYR